MCRVLLVVHAARTGVEVQRSRSAGEACLRTNGGR